MVIVNNFPAIKLCYIAYLNNVTLISMIFIYCSAHVNVIIYGTYTSGNDTSGNDTNCLLLSI